MSEALRNALSVSEKPIFDESITKREYHSYQAYSNAALGNNDEIRIAINQQDLYTVPAESYVYIQGAIVKPASVTEEVVFINNGALFLFDEIRYELNSVEIDKIRNPGVTSTIKGYISIPHTAAHRYQNAGWVAEGTKSGSFELCIPLSFIFGYAEDNKKLIINARQELILHRAASDINALKTSKAGCTVVLNRLVWKMPHVTVSDSVRLKLLKTLDARKSLSIAFRSWECFEYPHLPQTTKVSWAVKTSSHTEKPRYVVLAFQTRRKNQLDTDMSKFDHCSVSSLKVYLNSDGYPYDSLANDFPNDKYSVLYNMYAAFQDSYYSGDRADSSPYLTMQAFKSDAPLYVIDCSRQNDSVKTSPVDLRIELETSSNISAETSLYAVLLHDKLFDYNPLSGQVNKLV